MASDPNMEILQKDGGEKRKLGGLRTMPFIFSNEIFERFASTGFHANMITYLTQQLNMPLAKASNILTNFTGMASLTPLIGALAADSFAGRFWTISMGSVIYELKPDSGDSSNLWKLCTVHRVEELKSIIRIIPICSATILVVTAYSHQQSFSVQQARSMNRHISNNNSFQIPPATMSIFNTLTLLIGLVAYERILVPLARRFTKNPSGITCLQRMGIGFVMNTLSTVVAAVIEIKRKSVASKHGLLDKPHSMIPISVFWLVPQYSLHGLSEVFTSVGLMEFLYDQAPESMRSTAIALYWITISLGSYLSTLMVSLVHKYSGKNNWVPDRNLNRGKLDNYYWLVSCVQLINFFYYIVCAWLYKPKPLGNYYHLHISNRRP
ncbi:hypothetical protein AQUCO_03400011v1 [Aquilegia coerulea]|uniref:Major facilitator superfamily (MFS) profile domain-containing protein n=1 Tax=Aquilegia coerulea TaxID=218851 RepID=A0A2G5CX68_AQUCA|nr:hypothetical protein AQUCO_03400011v1 [Aquilegia coerulea]